MGQHLYQIDGRPAHRSPPPGDTTNGWRGCPRPPRAFGWSAPRRRGKGLLRQLLRLNHFHIKPFLSASAAPCHAPVQETPRPLNFALFQLHAEHQRSDQQTAIGKGLALSDMCIRQRHWQSSATTAFASTTRHAARAVWMDAAQHNGISEQQRIGGTVGGFSTVGGK